MEMEDSGGDNNGEVGDAMLDTVVVRESCPGSSSGMVVRFLRVLALQDDTPRPLDMVVFGGDGAVNGLRIAPDDVRDLDAAVEPEGPQGTGGLGTVFAGDRVVGSCDARGVGTLRTKSDVLARARMRDGRGEGVEVGTDEDSGPFGPLSASAKHRLISTLSRGISATSCDARGVNTSVGDRDDCEGGGCSGQEFDDPVEDSGSIRDPFRRLGSFSALLSASSGGG